MASRGSDQQLVAALAKTWPGRIVPCFGWHPWFSHTISLESPPRAKVQHYATLLLPEHTQDHALSNEDFRKILSSLPDPTPLSEIVSSIRSNLEEFPNAMLGSLLSRGRKKCTETTYIPPRAGWTGSFLSNTISPLCRPLASISHNRV